MFRLRALLALASLFFAAALAHPPRVFADASGTGCCGPACGSGCIPGCTCATAPCGYNPCSNGYGLTITSCNDVVSCAGQPPFSFGGGGGSSDGYSGPGGPSIIG